MKELLFVGFGGFIGSIARFLVSKLNHSLHFFNLPIGTLIVNILGSLLIGFLTGLFVNSQLSNENFKLFFITGICGGFTTFSAFSLENIHLFQQGQAGTAIIYITASVVLGILAVIFGVWMSKLIV